MKNFDLATYEVEEMSQEDMISIDGGIVEFLYEYITGRSLASDARAVTKMAVEASAQVIREGGKTSSQMPFP